MAIAQTTVTTTFTFVVEGPLALNLTPATLPPCQVGQPYSVQLGGVSGGNPPYTWTATGLPPGLTVSSTGLFSGTPTQAGSFNVTVTIADTPTTV